MSGMRMGTKIERRLWTVRGEKQEQAAAVVVDRDG